MSTREATPRRAHPRSPHQEAHKRRYRRESHRHEVGNFDEQGDPHDAIGPDARTLSTIIGTVCSRRRHA